MRTPMFSTILDFRNLKSILISSSGYLFWSEVGWQSAAAIQSFWRFKASITTYGTEAPPDNILDGIRSLESENALKVYVFCSFSL